MRDNNLFDANRYFWNVMKIKNQLFISFKSLLPVLFCFLFTNCKFIDNQIKGSFETVKKSLEKSSDFINNSIEKMYEKINTNRNKHPELAVKADSIFLAYKNVADLTDSLKNVLETNDSTGTNTVIPAKIINDKNTSDELKKSLFTVMYATESYTISKDRKMSLDSSLLNIRQIQEDNTVLKKYFTKTPTVGAVTILTMFKNECTNASEIVLGEIEKQFVN